MNGMGCGGNIPSREGKKKKISLITVVTEDLLSLQGTRGGKKVLTASNLHHPEENKREEKKRTRAPDKPSSIPQRITKTRLQLILHHMRGKKQTTPTPLPNTPGKKKKQKKKIIPSPERRKKKKGKDQGPFQVLHTRHFNLKKRGKKRLPSSNSREDSRRKKEKKKKAPATEPLFNRQPTTYRLLLLQTEGREESNEIKHQS